MSKLDDAIREVVEELARAARKFPSWPTNPVVAAAVVSEESGELARAVLHATYEPARGGLREAHCEAVQTAAMAIRYLIGEEDYKIQPDPQVKQVIDPASFVLLGGQHVETSAVEEAMRRGFAIAVEHGWFGEDAPVTAAEAALETAIAEVRRGSDVVTVADAKDYYVTVCSSCGCAACWHDEFRCEQSNTAGATVALASELRTAGRENESNYSISKLLQVEGEIRYADGSVRHG